MSTAYHPYHSRRNNNSTDSYLLGLIVGLIVVAAAISSFISADPNMITAIIILCGVIAGITATILVWWVKHLELQKLKALRLSDVDRMTGEEFEKYLEEILKFQSYKTNLTKRSGDFGTDIVARKNQEVYSIQAKRYKYNVSRTAISDAVAAMKFYGCNRSMVITTNYFSSDAKKFAEVNNCVLIDRDRLTQWILDFQNNIQEVD